MTFELTVLDDIMGRGGASMGVLNWVKVVQKRF